MKVLSFILLFSIADSLKENHFLHLNEHYDLTQYYINDIAQDSLGYIWFASTSGLTRFAGNHHYSYDLSVFQENDKNILSVKEVNGTLWATSRKGLLYRYDYFKDQFTLCASTASQGALRNICALENNNLLISGAQLHVYDVTARRLSAVFKEPSNYFRSIIRSGESFFVATSKGIYKLRADAAYSSFTLEAVFLKGKSILAIDQRGDTLFAGTNDGMLYILSTSGVVLSAKTFRDKVRSNAAVREVFYSSEQTLYLGVDQVGLVELNLQNGEERVYSHDPDDNHSLSTNSIHKIFADKEDRLWIGTYGRGVDMLDPHRKRFSVIQHEINNPNSLVDNQVRCVFQDSRHNLWFGTENGLSKFDASGRRWTNFTTREGLNNNAVLSIAEWQDKIAVGTYGGGINLIDKNNHRIATINSRNQGPSCPDFVFTCFTDEASNLWFGGQDGKLAMMAPNGALYFSTVYGARAITEDRHGNILVGTPNGIYTLDKSTNVPVLTHQKSNGVASLNSNLVTCLLEDALRNCLWIGTDGGGLNCFHYSTKTYSYYKKGDGLPSDMVYSIVLDNQQNVWIGTNNGLTKFVPDEGLSFAYHAEDGLPTNDFSFSNAIACVNDRVVFSSANGAVMFNPQDIITYKNIPRLYLANFSVSGKDIDPEMFGSTAKFLNHLELESRQNSVSFGFEALNFTKAGNIQFKYRLAGFEDQWSKPTHLSQVTYNNLDPGRYTLYYMCSNSDGMWMKEPLEFSFTIAAPFWRTPLAISLYCVFTVLALAALYSYNTLRRNKILAEDRNRTFVDIAHDINNLTSVISLSAEKISRSAIPLELKSSSDILMQNAQRLNRWVKQLIEFRMAEQGKMEIKVLPVSMRTYVENIIDGFTPYCEKKNIVIERNIVDDLVLWIDKYKMERVFNNIISNSIKYSYENSKIKISVEQDDSSCTFSFQDYGQGIPEHDKKEIFKPFHRAANAVDRGIESGNGIGLLISKHIMEMHGGSIEFESQLHTGSTFRLILKKGCAHFDSSQIVDEEVEREMHPVAVMTQPAAWNGAHVLVVEDDYDLRNALADELKQRYHVFSARDGDEGFLYALEKMPEIVITDVMMPGMTGIELCHKIKKDLATSHIPVIILTALDSDDHKLESINIGADAYLEKPVNMALLDVTIKNILNQRKLLKEYFTQPNQVANRLPHSTVNNFLKKVIDQVKANLKCEEYDIDQLCKDLGISRSVFFRKIKTITGLSPAAFVLQVKLNYAAELLKKDTGLSMVEIALESGFKNNKYFSTVFKNHFGLPPTEYRKEK